MEKNKELNFSIIIPHYEMPDLLKRCVESIPMRDDTEIIVVDDNSKDNEHYVEKYPFLQRKDLTFIPTHEGRWGGYARNVGLDHAKGKWLLFADSDDCFTENLNGLLDEYVNSSYDVVFFNIRRVWTEDITKPYTKSAGLASFERYKKGYSFDVAFRVWYSQPWGKLFRRSVVTENNIRFDEIKVCNDFWFCVQAQFKGKSFHVDDREIYYYTFRKGSVAYKCTDTLEKILIRLDVYLRVYTFLKQYGIEEKPVIFRSFLVILFKKYPLQFIKQICRLPSYHINVFKVLWQVFWPKYYSSKVEKEEDEDL